MRKVPFLIIGSGRLARHWAHYFSELGLDYSTWSRRDNTSAELYAKTQQARTVILALTDDAIESFVVAHPFLDKSTLCHCSGSRYFADMFGVHPLMSFTTDLYDLITYQTMAFIVDEPVSQFKRLFPELSNRYHAINPENKAFYHALCVMSGNFTTLMWQHVFTQMQSKLDIPVDFITSYLAKITENLRVNPSASATGPLVRGDMATINANLQALAGDPFVGVYQAFVKAMEKQ
jgi:predicted short-subunit dehydrogenase-like oxidoreductase (DUF2520 family)